MYMCMFHLRSMGLNVLGYQPNDFLSRCKFSTYASLTRVLKLAAAEIRLKEIIMSRFEPTESARASKNCDVIHY